MCIKREAVDIKFSRGQKSDRSVPWLAPRVQGHHVEEIARPRAAAPLPRRMSHDSGRPRPAGASRPRKASSATRMGPAPPARPGGLPGPGAPAGSGTPGKRRVERHWSCSARLPPHPRKIVSKKAPAFNFHARAPMGTTSPTRSGTITAGSPEARARSPGPHRRKKAAPVGRAASRVNRAGDGPPDTDGASAKCSRARESNPIVQSRGRAAGPGAPRGGDRPPPGRCAQTLPGEGAGAAWMGPTRPEGPQGRRTRRAPGRRA